MKIKLKSVEGCLIQAIKVIRNHTEMGLKEAKNLVDSAPCEINIKKSFPFMGANGVHEFLSELKAVGVDCEIVENAFLEDIMSDIKIVMHKCVDANEFEVFNELVAAFEMAQKRLEQ